MFPDGGCRPPASVEGPGPFPEGFARFLIDGEDARATDPAVGKVVVVVGHQNEQCAVDDGGAGSPVEALRSRQRLAPELLAPVVVRKQAE